MNLNDYFKIFEKYADSCLIFSENGDIIFGNKNATKLFACSDFKGLKVHNLTPNLSEDTDELIRLTLEKKYLKVKYNYKISKKIGTLQINMKIIDDKEKIFLALFVDITDEEKKKVKSDHDVEILGDELSALKMMYRLSSLFLDQKINIDKTLEKVFDILDKFYDYKYRFFMSLSSFNIGLKSYSLEFGEKLNNIILSQDIYIDGIRYGEILISSDYFLRENIKNNIDFEVFENIMNQIVSYLKIMYSNGFKNMTEIAVRDSSDAIIITDIDAKIVYANQSFTDKTGYYFEEVIGLNPSILSSGKVEDIYFKDMWKTIGNGIVWEGHFINKKRDGTIFEDDTTISPIRENQSGKVIGYVSLQKDVTEKIKMEKMLESVNKKRENLENIVNMSSSVAFMWNIDETRTIKYVSKNVLDYFGYSAEEFYSSALSYSNFIYNNDLKKVTDKIKDNIKNTDITAFNQRYRVVCKDKTIKWIDDSTFIIRKNNGKPIYLQGVIIDITEKIQTENRLNQAQKMESIGQLAAGIAHEINSPTQFVSDNTSFVKNSVQSLFEIIDSIENEKIEQIKIDLDYDFLKKEIPLAIDQSIDGLERITKIINAMKNFSHPGLEGKSSININENLDSTIIISKNSWKYIAKLVFNKCKNPPMVSCFIDELNQVFLNMIVNSVHAIEEKKNQQEYEGKIEINTSYNSKYFIIEFNDNGIGIDDKIKHKIFDPFFTTKEVGKGTGQGLSLSYDIIYDKHKGYIELDSVLGEGTTFKIFLPLE